MKKLSIILFLITCLYASAQVSISSVNRNVFCTGARITLTIHVGPDRSMFYDSVHAVPFGACAPDSFIITPYFMRASDTSQFSGISSNTDPLYLDSTMLNHDITYSFVAGNVTDSVIVYFRPSIKYNLGPIYGQSGWIDSPGYNTNTILLYDNLIHPSLHGDTTYYVCNYHSDASVNAISLSTTGQYIWTHNTDTAYGASLTLPLESDTNVLGSYNCIFYDTVSRCRSASITSYVNQKMPPNYYSSICVITLDSSLTHNVLIWDKNQPNDTVRNAAIDSFYFLRGSQQILSQPFSAYSLYTDYNANINLQSYTYEMRLRDVCGNIGYGNTVSTMFQLQPNNGDITWYPYNGATIGTYSVYRDATGNGNWTLLDTISSGGTTITVHDTNQVISPSTKYRVEAQSGNCTPRSIYTVYSNIRSAGPTGIATIDDVSLLIYPNPTSGILYFSDKLDCVTISDISGQIISSYKNITQADISGLSSGLYFVTMDGKTKRVVKI